MSHQAASSSGSYPISPQAYAKIVLHAAKYPSESVGGFILGSSALGAGILDVVPVFHGTPLGPILSNAAMAIEGLYSGDTNGSKIVGIYYGGKVGVAADPFFLKAVMSELSKKTEDGRTLLVRLENSRLQGEDADRLCVTVSKLQSGGADGKTLECKSTNSSQSNKAMNAHLDELLASGLQVKLVDFQGHMDNTDGDFRNTFIADALRQ